MLFEPVLTLLKVRAEGGNALPKRGGVVLVFEMRDFVGDDIINHKLRGERQSPVIIDVA